MITIRDYQRPATLEQAWQLNQKKANRVLGGMGWMKMGSNLVGTAIDLSALGLDQIVEDESGFTIGAMVSLRELETSAELAAFFGNAVRESVRHIVGVQFRNCATVGGTVWLRAGFSDPLTLFLALDCGVMLYQGGEGTVEVPLADFMRRRADNSILTAVRLKKTRQRVAYQSFRNTETDFPVLAVAVSEEDGRYRAAVGARPGRARAVEASTPEELVEKACHDLHYGDNLRGSAEYRKALAQVLIGRCVDELERS